MLKVDYLANVLHKMDEGSWFFMTLGYEKVKRPVIGSATDLLLLPQQYLVRMRNFILDFTFEDLEKMGATEFVEQSTGESYNKVVKLINVEKKKQSLEQDFI
jgi:hypothetical protein